MTSSGWTRQRRCEYRQTTVQEPWGATIGPIPLAVALLALDQRHIGPAGWLRKILPGLLPGAIAGLALWCGLRVGMRVVALAAGIPPSFSVSGTLEVLLIGLVLGASYGALLTAVWQSIAATRQAPGRWGGVALALWFWYPFFLAAEGNLSGMVAAPLIVLFTTLLSGMWIAYGLLLAALMRRFGSLPVRLT